MHVGREPDLILAMGLTDEDFNESSVRVTFQDGSAALFRRAFFVRHPHEAQRIAVFTEYNGHYEFELGLGDEVTTSRPSESQGESRTPGKHHAVPLADCPLCADEVDIVEDAEFPVYFAECPGCGVRLGEPYGYASRLHLAHAWNRRVQESHPKLRHVRPETDSGTDLEDAVALVEKLGACKTNGELLGLVLCYRRDVRAALLQELGQG